MTTRRASSALFGLALLAALPTARARGDAMKTYSIVDLGTPKYYGLNDLGQAFGVTPYVVNPNSTTTPGHQLFYDGRKVVDLGRSYTLLTPQRRRAGDRRRPRPRHDQTHRRRRLPDSRAGRVDAPDRRAAAGGYACGPER